MARKGYHHGDLRRALVEAALELAHEGGMEQVSVREAARRAGVSPAAPFRHFPDRAALLTAVAEEAMRRFRAEIDRALRRAPDEPLERLEAIGAAYLRWALRNPTHFEIISARRFIRFQSSASLRRDNEEIQAEMRRLLGEARRRGELRALDARTAEIAGRALVYGLARMHLDGHFPSWGVARGAEHRTMLEVLRLFTSGLAKSRYTHTCST